MFPFHSNSDGYRLRNQREADELVQLADTYAEFFRKFHQDALGLKVQGLIIWIRVGDLPFEHDRRLLEAAIDDDENHHRAVNWRTSPPGP